MCKNPFLSINKSICITSIKKPKLHLDTVKDLGIFIEFERKIKDFEEDHKVLEELMMKLEIKDKNLLKDSYSELA